MQPLICTHMHSLKAYLLHTFYVLRLGKKDEKTEWFLLSGKIHNKRQNTYIKQ